jgi:alkanesulfonate monooxygenase SsuD/methylene tetrahydromethanopterin reductase-like flavin-dependent oxidoreductase (luciferase family)
MKSIGLWTHYFDSETEMNTTINENAAKRNMSPKEYRKRISTGLWGTPEDLITRIQEFQKIGVTHFVFMFPEGQERDQIAKFGTHVLPKL